MTDLMTSGVTFELTIRRTIELAAPIERVWRALTDAAELARWLPQAADLGPGAGSEGWFDWGELGRYAVRVESAEAPTRVVWRWAREADVVVAEAEQSTTVEWTLTRLAGDRTRLDLYEWGFVDPAHHRGNSDGWDGELAELRTLVEG
jgi:uncharacterized protein YndB with AHSA1/START domain